MDPAALFADKLRALGLVAHPGMGVDGPVVRVKLPAGARPEDWVGAVNVLPDDAQDDFMTAVYELNGGEEHPGLSEEFLRLETDGDGDTCLCVLL